MIKNIRLIKNSIFEKDWNFHNKILEGYYKGLKMGQKISRGAFKKWNVREG